MDRLSSITGFIFSSYKRAAAMLFVAALLLAIPVTVSFLGQNQDIRQRASQLSCTELRTNLANLVADTGCQGSEGINQCNQLRNEILQVCTGTSFPTDVSITPVITQTTTETTSNEQICAQVITLGRNVSTNACQEFPTSCLPSGWIPVASCNTNTPTPISTSPTISSSVTPAPTCTPLPAGCIRNGQNICQFFVLPPGGWCPIANTTPSACPADAKLCPDGSAVGRSGPSCTFPACPGISITPIATIPVIPTTSPVCGAWLNYYNTLISTNVCNQNQVFCNQIRTQIQTLNCPLPSTAVSVTQVPGTQCALKSQGDANCDGKINTDDFNMWRDEFLGVATTRTSDFNNSATINTDDFNIWRDGFLNTSIPH